MYNNCSYFQCLQALTELKYMVSSGAITKLYNESKPHELKQCPRGVAYVSFSGGYCDIQYRGVHVGLPLTPDETLKITQKQIDAVVRAKKQLWSRYYDTVKELW